MLHAILPAQLVNLDMRLSDAGYCIVVAKGEDYSDAIHLGDKNIAAILDYSPYEVVRVNRADVFINGVQKGWHLASPEEIAERKEM